MWRFWRSILDNDYNLSTSDHLHTFHIWRSWHFSNYYSIVELSLPSVFATAHLTGTLQTLYCVAGVLRGPIPAARLINTLRVRLDAADWRQRITLNCQEETDQREDNHVFHTWSHDYVSNIVDVRFLMLMANDDVIVSYLDQLNNLRISEKDTRRALPSQFQDRCSNFMWNVILSS